MTYRLPKWVQTIHQEIWFLHSGKSWMVLEEISKLKIILQNRWHHGFTFSYGHKIVLRDLICSKCSIEVFCDDWKTLKQTDKKMSLRQKKWIYTLILRILKTQKLTITRMFTSMMMIIKAKLMNQVKMKRNLILAMWSGLNMVGFGILLKSVVWMMYPVICNISSVYKITVIVKLLIIQFISDWCSWWNPSWCSTSCKIYFYNGVVQHCPGKTTLVHRNTLWWKHSLRNLKKPSIMNKVLIVLNLFSSRKFFVILSSV